MKQMMGVNEVKKYRKRPVVIEALRWNGVFDHKLFSFINTNLVSLGCSDSEVYFFINTLEGAHKVTVGDYIIKGIKGEFYPCKPDIFEKTYDEAQ